MTRGGSWALALCAVGLALAASGSARGEEPPSPVPEPAPATAAEPPEVTEGRAAFLEGADLAKKGQWAEAREAFERSARLRSHPVTTYNLAFAERALGHLTRARAAFRAALADHDARRGGELTPELRLTAADYAEALDYKVLRVEVTVTPPGAHVAIDGRPLELVSAEGAWPVAVAGTRPPGPGLPAPAARFTLEIDAGPHTIAVSMPGEPEVLTRHELERGNPTRLTLLARPSVDGQPPRSPPPSPALRHAGFALLGVGGALGAAAAITGAYHFVNKSELEEVCSAGECPSDRADQIDATNALGTSAWVLLGAGVSSLVTGGVLVAVTQPRSDERGAASLQLHVGPASLALSGRF